MQFLNAKTDKIVEDLQPYSSLQSFSIFSSMRQLRNAKFALCAHLIIVFTATEASSIFRIVYSNDKALVSSSSKDTILLFKAIERDVSNLNHSTGDSPTVPFHGAAFQFDSSLPALCSEINSKSTGITMEKLFLNCVRVFKLYHCG